MNPVDRFTRDEASAKVWWPLAMLLIVAFVLTFPGQNGAVDQEREEIAQRASAVTSQVVDPVVAGLGDAASFRVAAEVTNAALDDLVLGEDIAVIAVRIWAADGTLLHSTSGRDEVGSQAALNDASLQSAIAAPGQPVTEQTAGSGQDAAPRIRIYQALPSQLTLIGEIEYDEDLVLLQVRDTWADYQMVIGIAGLVVIGFALLSMRAPVAPIGAGVRFYPTSVPEGMAVLGVDEATELRQAGAYARGRIESQQQRLQELEAAKYHLEGELQRSLSARSMTAAASTPSAIPRPEIAPPAPAGMPEPAPPPEVPVVSIPDRTPEPEPVVVPDPGPAPSPDPAPAPVAAVEPKRVKATRTSPTREPAKAAASADDSMGFVLVPETTPVTKPPKRVPPAEPVVKIPDSEDLERHDAQVLDVLERLVEPIGAGPATDPGEMRAKLARTAARKKPGSRADERFHEDPKSK